MGAAVFDIGGSLRDARDRQGIDLTRAETETKIRSRYLEALEAEDYELLPAPIYTKFFLRTYAGYLGLDAELFLDEYRSRFEHVEP